MSAELIATLRESDPYLRDVGWHQTAELVAAAAEEIERLSARVRQLERQRSRPRPRVEIVKKSVGMLCASSRWLRARSSALAQRRDDPIEMASINQHSG